MTTQSLPMLGCTDKMEAPSEMFFFASSMSSPQPSHNKERK
jgi:hypothetical protein